MHFNKKLTTKKVFLEIIFISVQTNNFKKILEIKKLIFLLAKKKR